jgi:hypothetical protein
VCGRKQVLTDVTVFTRVTIRAQTPVSINQINARASILTRITRTLVDFYYEKEPILNIHEHISTYTRKHRNVKITDITSIINDNGQFYLILKQC